MGRGSFQNAVLKEIGKKVDAGRFEARLCLLGGKPFAFALKINSFGARIS